MLVEKDFYTVQSFTNEQGLVNVSVAINASHKIFEGHFPGTPVVPGVCMTQMVKELLEKAISKETRLSKADNLKFLSIINPVENNLANVEIKYVQADGNLQVNATISNTNATCFKMKATFMLV